nr:hypothetical protein [Tanacetum cinerariifolium]
APTWWNLPKRTVRTDAAFAMSWRELIKLMAKRFQELTMMYTKMVPEEEDRVEKFIGGLLDNIQGNVIAAKPMRLQDAVMIHNNLMDQKLKGYTVKNDETKGGWGSTRETTVVRSHHSKGQMLEGRIWKEPIRLARIRENHRMDPKRSKLWKKARNKNDVGEARGKAYVLGGGDANPDSNVVKDVSYAIELADRRVSETNTILKGCTLVIVCDEKIVRIPYGDEVLIVQGNRGGKGEKLKLSIISCTKTQKYIKRGCPIFVAQVTKKETEDKSEEKRIEDVPTVRDFLEIFQEDLP